MSMEFIFLKLFNMSIAAGWLILAVIILRLFLKKAPKWLSCTLWAIAAVRLVCPFSFESPISLIPSAETLSPYTVRFAKTPTIDSGIPLINDALNPVIGEAFAPSPYASVNPLHILTFFAAVLWAAGLCLLLVFALINFLLLMRRVREAVPFKSNVWLCDFVLSPFILGIIRPRIYLSSGVSKKHIPYILAHEQAHLARRDHWWKLLGYLLLAVYWFHPLMWAAYALFCRDIELACDEKVIKNMNMSEKKAYSAALADCSMPGRLVFACPPAFGEIGVKKRIKTILSYRKPAFWMAAAAVMVCAAAALCFLTNPQTGNTTIQGGSINTDAPAGDEGSVHGSIREFPADDGHDAGDPLPESPDAAITAAIMEANTSHYSADYDFACCDFVILETVSAAPPSGDAARIVTYYGWELYQEYRINEDGIEDRGGSHCPVALTFEQDEDGYRLTEYWQPRDGSYFVPDVRSKFPAHIADDGIDSQKYGFRQMQSCYRQAVAFASLDTDAIIGRLLDTICAEPAASSNPQDYIDMHSIEYRELLYYGEYTLRYCTRSLEQDGADDLRGQIMSRVCEELSGDNPVPE